MLENIDAEQEERSFCTQSGRTTSVLAANFPGFSGNVMTWLIGSPNVRHILASACCPVWSEHLEIKPNYRWETFHFCHGCKVKNLHCPSAKFEIDRLQFRTFASEDNGLIPGTQRIERLTKSSFLPLSPLMLMSIADRQKKAFMHHTESIRRLEGLITCDKFLFSNTEQPDISLSWGRMGCNSLTFGDGGVYLEDYISVAFYNWEVRPVWTIRENALSYFPNRPLYSAVIEG